MALTRPRLQTGPEASGVTTSCYVAQKETYAHFFVACGPCRGERGTDVKGCSRRAAPGHACRTATALRNGMLLCNGMLRQMVQ